MKKTMMAVMAAALLLGGASWAADPCREPVETVSGLVRGAYDEDTGACSWTGIPYAAAPVGELRWKAPQPAPRWDGVRSAVGFGPRCMQKGLMEAVNADPSKEMSEDCLYLNVWSPAKSGTFPVMLWIHGGGYTGGTGNSEMYFGDRLARDGDVVVVTFNYRLNIFGFLAHPKLREEDPDGSTGSYGSLDQVAAIEWVRENIEGFKGDPDRITIFGESAGGWSVCTMLATPLNRGKLYAAILESGGCEASESLEEGYARAKEAAEKIGCQYDDLECLRQAPAEKVLRATEGQLGGFGWFPHHDGHLLTDSPLNMITAGDYNRVPFIAGFNRNEADALAAFFPKIRFATKKNYRKAVRHRLGLSEDEAERLVGLYPLSDYNGKVKNAFGQMFTHAALACPTYTGLQEAAKHQEDTWLYRFDYDDMRFGRLIGALHAMEIPFVFDSLDRPPTGMLYGPRNIDQARELAEVMQGVWTGFARHGNPNGEGLPPWPGFSPQAPELIVFDTVIRTERADMKDKCEFWLEYNKQHSPLYQTLGRKEKSD